MSTWEMFKFWLIKETMPLVIFLMILALLFGSIFVWAWVECTINDFKRWRKNAKRHKD